MLRQHQHAGTSHTYKYLSLRLGHLHAFSRRWFTLAALLLPHPATKSANAHDSRFACLTPNLLALYASAAHQKRRLSMPANKSARLALPNGRSPNLG